MTLKVMSLCISFAANLFLVDCWASGPEWALPTPRDIDLTSFESYGVKPAKAKAQDCIYINETFFEWMIRQTSRESFRAMAPYTDRSAVKGYANNAAAYVKTPVTLAVFTWQNIRQIVHYPFSSSFVMKAIHGHGMSILMVEGKLYDGLKRIKHSRSRLDPQWLKKKAISWMKICYNCDALKQYSQVRRGVILEEVVGDRFATKLRVFVFHGEPIILETREYVPDGDTVMHYHTELIRNGSDPLLTTPIQLKYSSEIISSEVMRDLLRVSRDLTRNLRFASVNFLYYNLQLYFKELDFSPIDQQELLNTFYEQEKDTMVLCPRFVNFSG